MSWYDLVYQWLVFAAVVSLVVLAVGSAAVLCCRQPARRIRLICLTLLGCLVAPWIGLIPGYPHLALPWWPSRSEASASPPMDLADSQHPRHATGSVPRQADLSGSRPPAPDGRAAQPEVILSAHASNRWTVPSLRLVVALCYLLSVCLAAVWWLVGMAGLVRLVRHSRPVPESCRELFRQIAGSAADRVVLLRTGRVEQPLTFGCWRPVIVLPEKLCHNARSLRWCLAHEWAHVERRHFCEWLLAGIVRVLFVYQPLVFWLRGQLRLCQDYVADGRAAAETGRPEDYAEFLTTCAVAQTRRPALAGLGIGTGKSELHRRVMMLVCNRRPLESRPPRPWNVLVTLAAILFLAAVSGLRQPLAAVAETESGPAEAAANRRDPRPLKPFTVNLPGDLTVELIGLCEHPSAGKKWWKPDGSSLAAPPYDEFRGRVRPNSDQTTREIVLRIKNPRKVPLSWKTDPTGSAAAETPRAAGDDRVSLSARATAFPRTQRSITVRLDYGVGQWQNVHATTGRGGTNAVGMAIGGVVAAPAIEKDGASVITMSHNIQQMHTRLIAIDTNGREHTPDKTSSAGAADFKQSTVTFSDLPLERVKEFRLQARPNLRVEFRNVSLKAGRKTDVQVVFGPGGKARIVAPRSPREPTSTRVR